MLGNKSRDYFLALYNNNDRCVGIFETYGDLANSHLLGNMTENSLLQMCSRYTKINKPEIFKSTENGITTCSLKVFASPPKLNKDKRFNKRKFGYTIYKIWEESE